MEPEVENPSPTRKKGRNLSFAAGSNSERTGFAFSQRGKSRLNRSEMIAEKTLGDYIAIIAVKKWIFLSVLLLAVMLSAVYAWTCTPLYTASATIEIEENKSKKEDRIYGSHEYEEYRSYLQSQLELLKSRSLAEAVVRRLNLCEHPEFSGDNKGFWGLVASFPSRFFSLWNGGALNNSDKHSDPAGRAHAVAEKIRNKGFWGLVTSLRSHFFSPWDDDALSNGHKSSDPDGRVPALAEKIRSTVVAKNVRQSNLATVSITLSDRSLASELLRGYLDVYVEQNLERKRRESWEASNWLRSELTKAEQRLLKAQADLAAFMIDNGIVSGQEKGLGQVMETINRTLDGHIKSREQRLKIQALKSQKRPEAGSVLPKDLNTEYVGRLKQQLAQHEADYSELKSVYDPQYPKMQALQKKIKFLGDRINQIEKGIVDTALDTATTEEDLFKENYDRAMSEAERVKVLEARLSVLRLDVDTSSEFHKLLVREYKEQEIKSRTTVNDVRVVDPPITPRGPSWPKKSLILLVGVCCGVLGGIAAALAGVQLDRTIRSPREIETDYHVQRLAVVPDFTKLPKSGTDLSQRPPEFMARYKPSSPIADAIRNLQTSIFLGNPDHLVRCMSVSSPVAGQGKTLIALNTAAILSSKEHPIVVVDADMRRPRLHKVFGLSEPGIGLADVLGSGNLDFSKVVHKDSIPGLTYITSGRPVGNPVDLLCSERLGQLFGWLRELFAYIVVDCPPVLGFSDAQLIGIHTDGIIMVIKQGEVGREELSEALGLISGTQGCSLLGVVFNQAHPGRGLGYRYGRRYHYGYYGYHGYYSNKG